MDLENFPDSVGGKRMLSYVTGGWYDKSYVGKWIYQVMGLEADKARNIFEELPSQFFVDLATWGLMYHEQKYGLPVRNDLSYEERRLLIREKRDSKFSMNPYRMESILQDRFGTEVHVYDTNDPGGFAFTHPNILSIQFVQSGDEDMFDIQDVRAHIDKIKLSHTMYDFFYSYHVWMAAAIGYQTQMAFYADISRQDCAVEIDQEYAFALKQNRIVCELGVENHMEVRQHTEVAMRTVCNLESMAKAQTGFPKMLLEYGAVNEVSCDAALRIVRNEWYIDGTYLLDGGRLLNAEDYVVEL